MKECFEFCDQSKSPLLLLLLYAEQTYADDVVEGPFCCCSAL
jgi:hypothetical protein